MGTVLDSESVRLREQQRLDQLKTARERNRWGQFATPPALSLDIARYAWNKLRRRKGKFTFLDPAIGTGSFYAAVLQTFPQDRIERATGIEDETPHFPWGRPRRSLVRERWSPPARISDLPLPTCGYLAKLPSVACRYEVPMDAPTQARYDARAKIIKAMAHPTRLFIVDELGRSGRRCVCELTEMIGADMSTVSKHLAILREAGIVEDQKRGSTVFYRLRVKCLPKFFECVETVLQSKARDQQKVLSCRCD
jgi:DNA-binding transcriptional ArsR family regulator